MCAPVRGISESYIRKSRMCTGPGVANRRGVLHRIPASSVTTLRICIELRRRPGEAACVSHDPIVALPLTELRTTVNVESSAMAGFADRLVVVVYTPRGAVRHIVSRRTAECADTSWASCGNSSLEQRISVGRAILDSAPTPREATCSQLGSRTLRAESRVPPGVPSDGSRHRCRNGAHGQRASTPRGE